MRRVLVFLITAILLPSLSNAYTDGEIRLGPQIAQVALLGDVGERHGSVLGYGAFFNYGTSDDLIFEAGFLTGRTTDFSHTEVNLGFGSYFSQWWLLYPRFEVGVLYISNAYTLNPKDLISSGFGIYAGAGVDYAITDLLTGTFVTRYVRGFEQTIQLSDGTRWKSIQDNLLFMIRVSYSF